MQQGDFGFLRPFGAGVQPERGTLSALNSRTREVAVRFRAIAFALVGLGLSSSVLAQGRTIEDTLVVTDPTVARAGMWKIGAAAEYWATSTTLDVYDQSGNIIGTTQTKLNQSGFNFFVGY